MIGETIEQKKVREAKDRILEQHLRYSPDPYPDESWVQTIQIGTHLFSPHWILSYAQARRAGVTCMLVSFYYAMWRSMHRGDRVVGPVETHEINDQRMDYLLLWHAQQLLDFKRRAKKKEQVPA